MNTAEQTILAILFNAKDPLQPKDILGRAALPTALSYDDLYQALQWLEKREYVVSMRIETAGAGLLRRYYRITKKGRAAWSQQLHGIRKR